MSVFIGSTAARGLSHRGFTLVEFMIAAALGLVVIGTALTFVFNSRVMHGAQVAKNRVQQNADFAIAELRGVLQMAGYYGQSNPAIEVPEGMFYLGDCGSFSPCTNEGAKGQPDRVAIMFNPPPDDGTETDCVGHALGTDYNKSAFSVIASVYYIGPAEDGVTSLMCQSFFIDSMTRGATQTSEPHQLLEGVYDLQVLYGTTQLGFTGSSNANIVAWEDAKKISAKTPPTGYSSPWVSIRAVQVGFLIGTGFNDRTLLSKSKSYKLFGDKSKYNDGNLRQVYTTTVMLNNANS